MQRGRQGPFAVAMEPHSPRWAQSHPQKNAISPRKTFASEGVCLFFFVGPSVVFLTRSIARHLVMTRPNKAASSQNTAPSSNAGMTPGTSTHDAVEAGAARRTALPTSTFLLPEELIELTGCKIKGGQIDWLRSRGWVFELSASGKPVVLRRHLERRLGGTESAAQGADQPNWAAMLPSPAAQRRAR